MLPALGAQPAPGRPTTTSADPVASGVDERRYSSFVLRRFAIALGMQQHAVARALVVEGKAVVGATDLVDAVGAAR
jgi:hypothetical protein